MHVFLRVPEGVTIKSRSGVYDGVDVRGEGGYVIVPPSLHLSGRQYEWINDLNYEVMEMPSELVDLLAHAHSAGLEGAGKAGQIGAAGWMRLSSDHVDEIRSALLVLSSEPREQWLRIGLALKSTGAGEQAYEIWDEWSKTCPHKYDPVVQRSTWNSVQEGLPDGSEVTIRTLFGAAYAAGWRASQTAPVVVDASAGDLEVEDLFTMEAREPDWLIEDSTMAQTERSTLPMRARI